MVHTQGRTSSEYWADALRRNTISVKLEGLTCMHAQLKKTYEIFDARSCAPAARMISLNQSLLCVLRCTQEVVKRLYKDIWSQSEIQVTVVTERSEQTLAHGCVCSAALRRHVRAFPPRAPSPHHGAGCPPLAHSRIPRTQGSQGVQRIHARRVRSSARIGAARTAVRAVGSAMGGHGSTVKPHQNRVKPRGNAKSPSPGARAHQISSARSSSARA